jgi:hypothetical protein
MKSYVAAFCPFVRCQIRTSDECFNLLKDPDRLRMLLSDFVLANLAALVQKPSSWQKML